MDRTFTYSMLEFDKVLAIVASFAQTSIGKEEILQLEAINNIEKVKKMLEITDEGIKLVTYSDTIRFSGKIDIENYLKHVEVDGFLQEKELLDVINHIDVSKSIVEYHRGLKDISATYFCTLVSKISLFPELENELSRCIDINGNIRDSASTEIRKTRKAISSKENEVKNKLSQIMTAKSKMLSEHIVTVRNNRQVLAVKAEFKHVFGGLIHDESISGQTVYIEPDECVNINNSVVELKSKLKNEIEKILRYLSNYVKVRSDEFRNNMYVFKEIDIMFAKARYSINNKCNMPIVSTKKELKILDARHPLIDKNEVVANDIILDEKQMMIITGANTGGKTITLKTVGLFALMTQVGLFISASSKSVVPIYDKVFTQMGDNQSLENNLSTFSSHIMELKYILENATSNSLVLLDEIGNGTNPSEGSALAIAILEELHNRTTTVFATTHFNEIKEYAEANDYITCASVKFDVENFSPTYKLMLNASGLSYALLIGEKLGLDKTIIENAKRILDENTDEAVNLLEKVNAQKIEVDELKNKLEEERLQLESIKADLSRKELEVNQSNEQILERAKKEANAIIEDALNSSQALFNKLSKSEKHHELLSAKKELEERKHKEAEIKRLSEIEIEEGDEVLILPFEIKGTVVRKSSSKEYEVLMGNTKSIVKKENLIFNTREKKREVKKTVSYNVNKKVSSSLDLRGLRVEEARIELEKYLDSAKLTKLAQVTIIHGYGTGAVRKMVIEVLNKGKYDYRSGGQGEGGSGATVVTLL